MSAKVLLCRCEDVTLAEVERAIDEGQDDIESLKRFTGFGTGWCQGKQCLVACARVLEERAGMFPLAPVTPRRILLRLCGNWHQSYLHLEDHDAAQRMQGYKLALQRPE